MSTPATTANRPQPKPPPSPAELDAAREVVRTKLAPLLQQLTDDSGFAVNVKTAISSVPFAPNNSVTSSILGKLRELLNSTDVIEGYAQTVARGNINADLIDLKSFLSQNAVKKGLSN